MVSKNLITSDDTPVSFYELNIGNGIESEGVGFENDLVVESGGCLDLHVDNLNKLRSVHATDKFQIIVREGGKIRSWATPAERSIYGEYFTVPAGTGEYKLTAKARGVKVTYDANGGTFLPAHAFGETYIDVGEFDEAFEILETPSGLLERSGYTFVKWTSGADGSGTAYLPKPVSSSVLNEIIIFAPVPLNFIDPLTAETTLYAQWAQQP